MRTARSQSPAGRVSIVTGCAAGFLVAHRPAEPPSKSLARVTSVARAPSQQDLAAAECTLILCRIDLAEEMRFQQIG